MSEWFKIHITDKTGKEFFKTVASEWGVYSEVKNLQKHVENSKKYPEHYKFLDAETAKVMVNDEEYISPELADDDIELLNQLMGD